MSSVETIVATRRRTARGLVGRTGAATRRRRRPAEGRPARLVLDVILLATFAAYAVVGLVPVALTVADVRTSDLAWVPVVLATVATVATVMRWPRIVGLSLIGTATALSIVLPDESLRGAPRILIGFVGFLLVLHFSRRVVNRAFPVVAVVYIGLHLLARPSVTWGASLDDAVLSGSLTLTGAVFVSVLSTTLSRLDDVRGDRVRYELDQTFRVTAARVTEDGRHLIHNEVIGTLSTVANYRGVGAAEIRAACGRVAELLRRDLSSDLREHGGGIALGDLVARASAETMVHVTVAPAAEDPLLDKDHAVALDRAVREALRNVRRHAGVDEATVEWVRDEGDWRLTLTDSGAGATGLTGSWGVTNAISRSLAAIGGTADITSVPGEGTMVELSWPTEQSVRDAGGIVGTHAETVRALGEDTSLALKVAAPVLAGNAWLALRYSWGDPTAVAQLALAAAVVTATFLVVLRLRLRPVSPGWLVVQSLATAATIWVGLPLAEPEALRGYDSWVVGLSSVMLTVTAFYTPLAWVAALVIPPLAVVAWQAIASGLSLGASGGALNAVAVPMLLGGLFGAALRWTRSSTDREELRVAQLAEETHRRQLVHEAAGQQLMHARTVVGPWLGAVARAATLLDEVGTTEEAAHLALEMRDDLHLPGLLDPVLRRRIGLARRRGVRVELLAPDEEPHGTQPYLRLLDRALDLDLEQIIVDFPNGQRTSGEVAVLPPVDGEELDFLLRTIGGSDHTVVPDTFSTRILLQGPVFTGRGPSEPLL